MLRWAEFLRGREFLQSIFKNKTSLLKYHPLFSPASLPGIGKKKKEIEADMRLYKKEAAKFISV